MKVPYEPVYDVTAEAGIKVWGKDLKELFCNALLATFNEVTDLQKVRPLESRRLEAEGELPYLLADFINEALLLFEREKFVPSRCKVLRLAPGKVEVLLEGEKFDPSRHEPKLLIKAATYYRLKVQKKGEKWEGEVIFDV